MNNETIIKNEHTWISIKQNGFINGYPRTFVTGGCDICNMFPCKHTDVSHLPYKILTNEQLKERK